MNTASQANAPNCSVPEAALASVLQPRSIAVTGGGHLSGTTKTGPSVRAAQILLAASAVATRSVKLVGLPAGAHIEQMISMLEAVGCAIDRSEPAAVTVKGVEKAFDPSRLADPPDVFNGVGRNTASRNSAAMHLIPAMLRRHGCVALPWPSAEPIDDVLEVYKAFGDSIETRSAGYSIVAAGSTRSTGSTVEIAMRTRSAAPTLAAVLRACTAESRIIIHHPSRRPEVHALFTALSRLGWRGHFTDDRLDLDPGATPLRTLTWPVPDDEFAAAACISALAATRSTGTVAGVTTRNVTVLRMLLTSAGARVELKGDQAKVYRAWTSPGSRWEGLTASAGTGPRDLPSEQLGLVLAMAPTIRGRHQLTDPAAPARTDQIISALKAFEAPISAGGEPGQVIVTGPGRLTAPRSSLEVFDASLQAALVIAALTVKGTTVIDSIDYLEGAHPGLLKNLSDLGATIHGDVL